MLPTLMVTITIVNTTTTTLTTLRIMKRINIAMITMKSHHQTIMHQ